jgi:uncharacterized linocin/CFP29 family protein
MELKYLGREDAPIAPETWKLLDTIMVVAAKTILTGRRLLNIEGPYGLGLKGFPLEDCTVSECRLVSRFVPVHMISRNFVLGVRDLVAYEQTGLPFFPAQLKEAAITVAQMEDSIIFEGTAESPGLLSAQGVNAQKLASWNTVGKAADDVIQAMITLDEAGYHGPYALALSPGRFNLLYRRYLQGIGTELEHIRTIVTEGVFKAPVMKSGGVLLATGKKYASLPLGQDMAAGFVGPMGDSFEFSVSESLALLIREPASICVLREKA